MLGNVTLIIQFIEIFDLYLQQFQYITFLEILCIKIWSLSSSSSYPHRGNNLKNQCQLLLQQNEIKNILQHILFSTCMFKVACKFVVLFLSASSQLFGLRILPTVSNFSRQLLRIARLCHCSKQPIQGILYVYDTSRQLLSIFSFLCRSLPLVFRKVKTAIKYKF